MSFERSHARDRSETPDTAIAILPPPGKHGGTDRLSAPAHVIDARPHATDHAAGASLTGTDWLDGVLGFGEVTTTVAGASDPEPRAETMTSIGGDGQTEIDHADGEVESDGRSDAPLTGKTTGHTAKPAPIRVTTTTVFRAPSGAPDSRRAVGVGESVVFHATQGGSWTASHGTKIGHAGKTFTWTAPETGGSTTVTFHHANKTVHTAINVIAPNTLAMKVAKHDSIPKGTMGAGMITNVTIGPTSVSFGNVEWLEVPGGPSSVSGYFKDHGA
ncbi:MAG TPA: hypothetical protein VGO00_01000, partial [Kofleriaceae bacterium]|nr:hypothetical protein [Kofleriaceae bacterium]